jgi:hypothetical protein
MITTTSLPAPMGRGVRPLDAPQRTEVRIWLPLIVVWIVLAPFLVLLSPLLIIGLAMAGLNPFRALAAGLGLLAALGGTRVEVDTPDALVNIHLV